MFIYKITNLINGKIYIGQTINSVCDRFKNHINTSNNQKAVSFLHNSIKKYGIENFKIEEIDGANSQSELNYKEWLYIYKFNSLAPNGYNLKEGGGSKGKASEYLKNYLSSRNYRCKKVINKVTGVVYSSVKVAYKENNFNYSINCLFSRLNGTVINDTDLIYLNEDKDPDVFFTKKSNKIINTLTKKIYPSERQAYIAENLNIGRSSLQRMLKNIIPNTTNLKYLDKNFDKLTPTRRLIKNKITGVVYSSIVEAHSKEKFHKSIKSLRRMLNGTTGNKTDLIIVRE